MGRKIRKAPIVKLANAIKDISSSPRTPVRQKVKESKLLLDLERQQKTYGTIPQTIEHETDVQQQEPKPSTLTQITEGAKDLYRRLSGIKKVNTHKYQQMMKD